MTQHDAECSPKSRSVSWDKHISLGNIITIVTLLVAGVGWAVSNGSSVSDHERRLKEEERATADMVQRLARVETQFLMINTTLARVELQLERIADRRDAARPAQ